MISFLLAALVFLSFHLAGSLSAFSTRCSCARRQRSTLSFLYYIIHFIQVTSINLKRAGIRQFSAYEGNSAYHNCWLKLWLITTMSMKNIYCYFNNLVIKHVRRKHPFKVSKNMILTRIDQHFLHMNQHFGFLVEHTLHI
jgi:hypothetical protein